MTPQEKLVELAKIDKRFAPNYGQNFITAWFGSIHFYHESVKYGLDYFTNRDTIANLISTQPGTIIERITWLINHYERTYYKQYSYLIPAGRLADYLLMAHGKLSEPDNMMS